MKNDVKMLKKEFVRIKNMGFIKAMRKGTTGIGYTFETLLNKKEDQESKPDFKSIELKCKLGYSKSAITLFNCAPKRKKGSALNYIYENYSHFHNGNTNDSKLFERKVFSKYYITREEIYFKLVVDFYHTEIIMKSYENGKYIEDVCSWDFKLLERKLKGKLSNLAIIQAYPYRKNHELYYKYLKMNVYKLKGFLEFLHLIVEDKIYVNFYIKSALGDNNKRVIYDHGVGFRIKNEYIEELFYKLKY